jgi:hypothetical protein
MRESEMRKIYEAAYNAEMAKAIPGMGAVKGLASGAKKALPKVAGSGALGALGAVGDAAQMVSMNTNPKRKKPNAVPLNASKLSGNDGATGEIPQAAVTPPPVQAAHDVANPSAPVASDKPTGWANYKAKGNQAFGKPQAKGVSGGYTGTETYQFGKKKMVFDGEKLRKLDEAISLLESVQMYRLKKNLAKFITPKVRDRLMELQRNKFSL